MALETQPARGAGSSTVGSRGTSVISGVPAPCTFSIPCPLARLSPCGPCPVAHMCPAGPHMCDGCAMWLTCMAAGARCMGAPQVPCAPCRSGKSLGCWHHALSKQACLAPVGAALLWPWDNRTSVSVSVSVSAMHAWPEPTATRPGP